MADGEGNNLSPNRHRSSTSADEIRSVATALSTPYAVHSAGGNWMPSASPNSQSFSYCPIEIQFTTRAVTSVLAGRPSKRTRASISRGRPNRAAHPWGFTKITKHPSEKGSAGLRPVRLIGISQGIRVPRRPPDSLAIEATFKFIGSRHDLKAVAAGVSIS